MDDQAGKGRDFVSQRLHFHALGDLQILSESLEKLVNITIEKGDLVEEGNVYRCFGNVYFSQSDFRKAIAYHENI